MRINHLNIFLFFLLTWSADSLSGQGVFTQKKDSASDKMVQYMQLIRLADKHQIRAEEELSKVLFYKSEARNLLDSAYAVSRRGGIDKPNARLYLQQLNFLFAVAFKVTEKADSVLNLAIMYKDSALLKNKEAESYYLSLAQDYKPVVDSAKGPAKTIYYTVQVGAGKMHEEYFKNVMDLETITPSDGIRRYITGRFATRVEALEFREVMIKAGYTDAFIRTMDSLSY